MIISLIPKTVKIWVKVLVILIGIIMLAFVMFMLFDEWIMILHSNADVNLKKLTSLGVFGAVLACVVSSISIIADILRVNPDNHE